MLRGVDAAAEAGLAPVKVNMVVRRGLNDGQILPMARRFRHSGHILRFIEYMDVGNTNGWNMAEVVPSSECWRASARNSRWSPSPRTPWGAWPNAGATWTAAARSA